LTQAAQASAKRADANETAALWQLGGAINEAEFGNGQRARSQTADALSRSPTKNVEILAAFALARSGDRKRAESLAGALSKQFPSDTILNNYWVPGIRAAIAMDEKNPGKAIEVLRAAEPYDAASPVPGVVELYPVYLRGLAYLQARRGPQAAVEFRKVLRYSGIVLNFPIGALAHLQLARAQAMSGDNASARQSYRDFLTLWKDADPDLPIYEQAKAEYAKLQQ